MPIPSAFNDRSEKVDLDQPLDQAQGINSLEAKAVLLIIQTLLNLWVLLVIAEV